jgi:hypothetical protein
MVGVLANHGKQERKIAESFLDSYSVKIKLLKECEVAEQ